ncbi:hypothetical protein QWZ06_09340 [Chryseobacterium tructae]|uniref:C1q domain-containing protein n=1 Tax=Chryseobacterium tructae TaxID=1037380 RepID=A0ABV7XW02_9FLAO|nr:hypothetical protein [Chryseobacterium tructae]MDN3692462.1 hypothetical protein [Chryseobacterium tructae]
MKRIVFFFKVLVSVPLLSQVGINEINPSATLDIKSKGNTNGTKALEINNSNGQEMVTVLDNGNVGINVPSPKAKLHTNGSLRYENLPVISGNLSPLAIKGDGTVGTYVPAPTKYLYMTIASTVAIPNFPLADQNQYTSIPLTSAQSVTNTINAGFGTDSSVMFNINGITSSGSNVNCISFPEAGVYKINLNYYTSCTGEPTAHSGFNFLGIGTVLFKADAGSTVYNGLAVVRYNALTIRTNAGEVAPNSYNFALPHNVFLILRRLLQIKK